MRLLFLTPQAPFPPHAGGALRTFGLLTGLHQAGIITDLLSFAEGDGRDLATTPLAALCRRVVGVTTPQRSMMARLANLIGGHADMESRFYSDEYARALTALLKGETYDVIQFEGLELATYLPLIRSIQPSARTIYGAANAEFDLQRLMFHSDRRNLKRLPITAYSLIQWRQLRRFERHVCQTVSYVTTTSDPDAEALTRLAPGIPIRVVPNGIFVSEYRRDLADDSVPSLDLGSAALLFTGTMDYRPNVDAVLWFAESILGRIRATIPEARMFVVGKGPHPRLDPLRQRPDVEITGYVQDVIPFLHSCVVYVAPLRMGSGTRLKLLQAMAAGRACVSTTIGAGGLGITQGRELLIADDVAGFADAVIGLLRDPARRAAIGAAAYQFVCDHYDWTAIMPRMLKVYEELGVA